MKKLMLIVLLSAAIGSKCFAASTARLGIAHIVRQAMKMQSDKVAALPNPTLLYNFEFREQLRKEDPLHSKESFKLYLSNQRSPYACKLDETDVVEEVANTMFSTLMEHPNIREYADLCEKRGYKPIGCVKLLIPSWLESNVTLND
jgi:hypothetical protein